MAIKRINQHYFLIDSLEDLTQIPNPEMGSECFVIAEACEYKANSAGEWFRQVPATANTPSVDTSSFATKEELESAINSIEVPSVEGLASIEFVEEAVASVQIPSVDGLASEEFVAQAIADASPVKDVYGDAHTFGLMVDSSDNTTLVDAMLAKGKVGMYNFHIEKGSPGQPEEVVAKNSSCRGIACVDTYRSDTNWYGWIIMFDHDGDMYTQYIRNAEPKGWKKLLTM